MPRKMQTALSGGELSPSLHSHADLQKYSTGLALCENWYVLAQGGITTRPGFEWIVENEDSASLARAIPFQFNTEQAYALIFTDQKMRVIRNGGVVLESTVAISGATQANPVVVTATGHGYSNGDDVFITGVVGMTEINDRFFRVANVTANTFELTDFAGTNINGTGYTAYSSGGTVARLFTLTTPYLEADLFRLKYTQSADVMTITHPDYDVRNLSRTAHNAWTLTTVSYASSISAPAHLAIEQVGTSATTRDRENRYVVTAVAADGDESAASDVITSGPGIDALDTTFGNQIGWSDVTGASYYNVYKEFALQAGIFGWIGEADDIQGVLSASISGATQANPCVVTATGHGFTTGQIIIIYDVAGMVELNDRVYTITVLTADTFELDGVNSIGYTAYTSGGTAELATRFTDYNFGPDMSVTPPQANDPFAGTGNKPSCTTYHQQRQIFGSTTNQPQAVFATRTADFDNMDKSRPTRADDSIEATISARQVNEIRHLLSLGDLLIFTSGGEWIAAADSDGILTPSNINFQSQGFRGSSHVPPITIGETALFVQEKGARVRDFLYTFETDKYGGNDLSVLSRHMFEGYQIVDWCYSQEPYSIVWAVRDDGQLLSMTYLREHQVYGWARHVTDGSFESVCCVSEGNEDVLYAVVKRTINGNVCRFTERMSTKFFSSVEDAFCVDAGLTYTASTYTISGATAANPVVITSTGHGLSDGDVIRIYDVVGMTELNDMQYKVANSTANTFELTDFNNQNIDGTAYTAYVSGGTAQFATNTLTGLYHLEGETLVALADGNAVDSLVVSGGGVTLPNFASVVHVGLGYNCDFQTLEFAGNPATGLAQSRRKQVARAVLRVLESRGLAVGRDTTSLYEFKERTPAMGYENIPLLTQEQRLEVRPTWNDYAQIYVRQAYPLPATVLAVIPEVEVSG